MKLSKSQVILYCFDLLLSKGELHKTDVFAISSVSEASFTRYIQEIRAYLSNFHNDKELVYRKAEDVYLLVEAGRN